MQTVTMSGGVVKVGDFVQELLVTDTRAYEVVCITKGGGLRLLSTVYGETVKRDYPGGPFPVSYTEVLSIVRCEGLRSRLVKPRKDGTYRMYEGGNPLRLCMKVEGTYVTKTDYRM